MSEIYPDILEKITERYTSPIKIGSRVEAQTYYRVEDLDEEDTKLLSEVIAERIINVCSPNLPELIIRMPGTYTTLAELLSVELAPPGEEKLDVFEFDRIDPGNGTGSRLKGTPIAIVTDVITTARSCLEAHSQTTMMGSFCSLLGCNCRPNIWPWPCSRSSSVDRGTSNLTLTH